MKVIMDGVFEACEGMDVSLIDENGRTHSLALNEAGYNSTRVDLDQLLEWVAINQPERYKMFNREV